MLDTLNEAPNTHRRVVMCHHGMVGVGDEGLPVGYEFWVVWLSILLRLLRGSRRQQSVEFAM